MIHKQQNDDSFLMTFFGQKSIQFSTYLMCSITIEPKSMNNQHQPLQQQCYTKKQKNGLLLYCVIHNCCLLSK